MDDLVTRATFPDTAEAPPVKGRPAPESTQPVVIRATAAGLTPQHPGSVSARVEPKGARALPETLEG